MGLFCGVLKGCTINAVFFLPKEGWGTPAENDLYGEKKSKQKTSQVLQRPEAKAHKYLSVHVTRLVETAKGWRALSLKILLEGKLIAKGKNLETDCLVFITLLLVASCQDFQPWYWGSLEFSRSSSMKKSQGTPVCKAEDACIWGVRRVPWRKGD